MSTTVKTASTLRTGKRLLASPTKLCRTHSGRFGLTVAMVSLVKKNAVLTGASRGIGLEFVKQLLEKDNTVVAGVRVPEEATALLDLADAHRDRLAITRLDVSCPASVEGWAKDVARLIGHVDLLVNNAGVVDGWAAFDEVTADDMLYCFSTNCVGPLLVTQQLLQARLLGPPGSLVANMTSKMGSIADNSSGGDYAYRASKTALNIVNKTLAIDLARQGVGAVLLHPGYVKTDMTEWEGLIGTAECVQGLLAVLESNRELNGRWFDYKGMEIPW